MRSVGVAILILCGIVACSRASTPRETFLIAQQWEPRSLNPALENGTSAEEWGLLVFSYLVKLDDRGRLTPDVATEVPTVRNGGISADGKTIVYHIRHGVRFADGVALTAADCAWSIDAILNPRNNVQSRFAYDAIAKTETPDPYTLVLHLKRSFPPVLTIVEAPLGFPILPKHLLARYSNVNQIPFNLHPLGSGPYQVVRWQHGDRVELVANPHYWNGAPRISKLAIEFVPSSQTALNLLRTHAIDAYFDEQDRASYPQLQSVDGYRVTRTPQHAVGAVIFNTHDPVTSDARVRHALAEAIDVRSLVRKAYRGALVPGQGAKGLFIWAFDPHVFPDVPYDPVDARRLLDAAGWHAAPDGTRVRDGKRLELLLVLQSDTPGDAAVAAAVAQYERAVGADVTLKAYEITQFVAPAGEGGPVYSGKFQMALYDFENGDDPDTTDQFACANVPPNGYNKSRICDPRIDALLAQGLTTFDHAKRTAIYRKLQALLYEDLPILPLYQRAQINVFTDRLQGQTTSPNGAFWNVAAWSLAAPRSRPGSTP